MKNLNELPLEFVLKTALPFSIGTHEFPAAARRIGGRWPSRSTRAIATIASPTSRKAR